ncbi:flagellar hook-basal body complex protein FliE [bacterium]|nr:flagellar hook-basal body complex protein FliE [bacterium]
MAINGITSITSALPELTKVSGSQKAESGTGFSSVISDSMKQVNAEMNHANKMSQEFVTEGKHDLHEVLIELEKADMSFRYMNQVRNKVLDAYQEIMRIQV